ncbi:MAG: disulfide bond formation protein B [Chlamydiales bacterium]
MSLSRITQYAYHIISALLVITLAGVITAGFGYQAIMHQAPCPLCFLQRVAMIGVALGQVFNFYFGVRMSHHALSLFHCLLGATISLRQISLHVCPGFSSYGSPVWGYELYTWALVAFFCSLLTIGALLALYKPEWKPLHSPFVKRLEQFAFLYIVIMIVADLVAAAMICGLGACPDNP